MDHALQETPPPVRARLLQAALDSFLADDYHRVTTRRIAERAQANVSMIRYYFGNKEGLYEEMIRETLNPLLAVLDGPLLSSVEGFAGFFHLYYQTMATRPEFPKLMVKVLALKRGPGRRFIVIRRAATETYQEDRRGSEHRTTQQIARADNPSVSP